MTMRTALLFTLATLPGCWLSDTELADKIASGSETGDTAAEAAEASEQARHVGSDSDDGSATGGR